MITAFGRLGHWFGSERYDIRPDLITCAKGLSSAYASIGAVVARDAVMEPFLDGAQTFTHGITFGGHPVQAAIALKNLEIMQREGIVEHVREHEEQFRSTLAQLLDLPIVGDLRGAGYFYALELVKDKETRAGFSEEESETLLRGFLSPRLFERGLICRADDRGDPVIQISPPLIAGPAEFDEIVGHPRRGARRGLERAQQHAPVVRRAGGAHPAGRLSRFPPAVWAATGLLVWSVVAIGADAEAAPPLSVLVVVVLGIALASAHNRRMRTTGRLLLAFLAFVFVTAELRDDVTALTAVGLALSVATGVLAIVELVRGRR